MRLAKQEAKERAFRITSILHMGLFSFGDFSGGRLHSAAR